MKEYKSLIFVGWWCFSKIDQNDQNEKNDQNDQDDQDDDGLGGQLLLLFFISSIVDLVTGEWEEEWLKDWGSDRFSN